MNCKKCLLNLKSHNDVCLNCYKNKYLQKGGHYKTLETSSNEDYISANKLMDELNDVLNQLEYNTRIGFLYS